jgi:membrane-bound serine protease (ClpP class)
MIVKDDGMDAPFWAKPQMDGGVSMKDKVKRIFFFMMLAMISFVLLGGLCPAGAAGTGDAAILGQAVTDTGQQEDWVKPMAQTLTGFWISTLLLTIGLVCTVIEILTLNGLMATIGILTLLVFFLSHITMGHVPWWIIFIFFLGLGLLVLELFVTPGWGIPGTLGLILMFASIFAAIGDPNKAAVSMLISMSITGTTLYFAVKKLPHSDIWKKLTLHDKQSSSGGYNAIDNRPDLEGAVGVAATDLRPGGLALINEERIDVVTRGEYVKKDSPVRVAQVSGMRIVVEAVEGKW